MGSCRPERAVRMVHPSTIFGEESVPQDTVVFSPGPSVLLISISRTITISRKGDRFMSTMDLLVHEVESQFGMSRGKAGSLLSLVLRLVQEQNGGLSGFLDRFRRIGLSDMVSGW